MALVKGDTEKVEEFGKAFDRAHLRFDVEMWDDKDGYYHAWFDEEWGTPSWLMADSLYGQVWAYTLGLGDILEKDKMKSHLLKERENNDTPYGLKVRKLLPILIATYLLYIALNLYINCSVF